MHRQDMWNKSIAHFASMCCDILPSITKCFLMMSMTDILMMALSIFLNHHIQSFILKSGDSVHDQPNNNGLNSMLNNLYGNARMNRMRKHGTIKFVRAHTDSVFVETWESFTISSATITQHYIPLLSRKSHKSPSLPFGY